MATQPASPLPSHSEPLPKGFTFRGVPSSSLPSAPLFLASGKALRAGLGVVLGA